MREMKRKKKIINIHVLSLGVHLILLCTFATDDDFLYDIVCEFFSLFSFVVVAVHQTAAVVVVVVSVSFKKLVAIRFC